MNLFYLITDFLWWRRDQKNLSNAIQAILPIEMQYYTYRDILYYVATRPKIIAADIGPLSKTLYCRAGRGDVTLEQAVECYILNREVEL